jgi:hypothetical protein
MLFDIVGFIYKAETCGLMFFFLKKTLRYSEQHFSFPFSCIFGKVMSTREYVFYTVHEQERDGEQLSLQTSVAEEAVLATVGFEAFVI